MRSFQFHRFAQPNSPLCNLTTLVLRTRTILVILLHLTITYILGISKHLEQGFLLWPTRLHMDNLVTLTICIIKKKEANRFHPLHHPSRQYRSLVDTLNTRNSTFSCRAHTIVFCLVTLPPAHTHPHTLTRPCTFIFLYSAPALSHTSFLIPTLTAMLFFFLSLYVYVVFSLFTRYQSLFSYFIL